MTMSIFQVITVFFAMVVSVVAIGQVGHKANFKATFDNGVVAGVESIGSVANAVPVGVVAHMVHARVVAGVNGDGVVAGAIRSTNAYESGISFSSNCVYAAYEERGSP